MIKRSIITTIVLMIAGLLAGCIAPPTPSPIIPAPSPSPTTSESIAAIASPSATRVVQPSPSPTTSATPIPVAAKPTATKARPSSTAPTAAARPAQAFARYVPPPTVAPAVPSYSVGPDLSNVDVHPSLELSSEARKMLVKNAFVVTPGDDLEFFQLYEKLSYDSIPAFVTTDSALHVYHLVFDRSLRDAERQGLATSLIDLSESMLAASQRQLSQLQGTSLESAARRNVAFFAVGARLAGSSAPIPPGVADLVTSELKLIDAHAGIAESPIFGYREDYGQYVPRGHYTRSDQLKSYFRAMMWYGRLTFLCDPTNSQSADLTRSALLIVSALGSADGAAARASWDRVYDTTAFFVGFSDDLTFREYGELATRTFGGVADPSAFADEARLNSFMVSARDLRPARINSMVVESQSDRESQIKGFRFMGQRFVVDAAIFQELVEPAVPGRSLPRSLDIPAALGSDAAHRILQATGESRFPRYFDSLAKQRDVISALPESEWTQNLYWGWLSSLRPLVEVKADGYPAFMRTQAWADKDLNTFVGSWTELKHDTVLYAKQVYAERGDAISEAPRGYVEPNPEVFGRLAALASMTRSGLESRGLLTEQSADLLSAMIKDMEKLADISRRELAAQPLTVQDLRTIESFGSRLEYYTLQSADPEDPTAPPGRQYLQDLSAALVADVATDPSGAVLEEATGRIFQIYVVVPHGGGLVLTKGGVFSQYEFTRPLSERLTDEAWKARLEAGDVPALPAWTSSYVVAD